MAVSVKNDLKGALKKYFGFESFKGIQEEIINNVLATCANKSIVYTGFGGYSFCF